MTAQSILEPLKKTARITAIAAAVVATAFVAGCGGGGGSGTRTTTPTPTGSNITPTTVVQRATDALGLLDFFPSVTEVLNIVTGTLPTLVAGVASSLTNQICLGGAGTTTITWGDLDSSNTFTAGDTLTLEFTSCQFGSASDTTTGTVTLTLPSDIGLPLSLPLALTLGVDVDITTTSTLGSERIQASFDATIAATSLTAVTFTYGTGADTDLVSASSAGAVTGQLGCFSVAHTVDIVNQLLGDFLASTSTLVPQAITMNTAGEVTVVDGAAAGTLALTLDTGTDGPTAGIVNLLSAIPAGMLPCPALSIDASGVTSDGSYATLTADADGVDATLQVFDALNAAVGAAQSIDWVDVF